MALKLRYESDEREGDTSSFCESKSALKRTCIEEVGGKGGGDERAEAVWWSPRSTGVLTSERESVRPSMDKEASRRGRLGNEAKAHGEEFGDGEDADEIALNGGLLGKAVEANEDDGGKKLDEIALTALLRDE